jgi:hypothetical protein
MQFRTIDGLSIRFAESEPRDQTRAAIEPVSGEPVRVRADVGATGGQEFIVRLADAFGLDQPHAVGPDIATAALLFAAASRRRRFRSLSGEAAALEVLGAAWLRARTRFGERVPALWRFWSLISVGHALGTNRSPPATGAFGAGWMTPSP